MNKETRLPQNGKEGFLYGGIICAVTATIMCTVNVGIAFGGYDREVLFIILRTIPIMWVVAMALETFMVGRIAEKLVEKYSGPTDGFNARILFTILFCAAGMSVSMTILGGLVGNGLSLEPFKTFPMNWPRNFCVAIWCEILLAQPLARFAMKKLHGGSKSRVEMERGTDAAVESTSI